MVSGADRLLDRDGTLRQAQRLVVPMPYQGDIRLVMNDPRQYIVRLDGHRETFTLTQSRGCFFVPATLREQHAGQ